MLALELLLIYNSPIVELDTKNQLVKGKHTPAADNRGGGGRKEKLMHLSMSISPKPILYTQVYVLSCDT